MWAKMGEFSEREGYTLARRRVVKGWPLGQRPPGTDRCLGTRTRTPHVDTSGDAAGFFSTVKRTGGSFQTLFSVSAGRLEAQRWPRWPARSAGGRRSRKCTWAAWGWARTPQLRGALPVLHPPFVGEPDWRCLWLLAWHHVGVHSHPGDGNWRGHDAPGSTEEFGGGLQSCGSWRFRSCFLGGNSSFCLRHMFVDHCMPTCMPYHASLETSMFTRTILASFYLQSN